VPPKPHDALARSTLSRLELAAPYFQSVLPGDLREALDFETLEHVPGSFIDPDLSERQTDLLFRAELEGGGESLLYVLVEHQSTVERRMSLRLLVYVGRILDRWRKEHPDAERVPAVFPVVLYSGPRAWTAPTDLHSLLDLAPPPREAAEHYSPQLRYAVDDLVGQTDERLEARPGPPLIRLTLLLLRHGHDDLPTLMEFLARAAGLLNALSDPDDCRLAITYILLIQEEAAREVLEALKPALSPDTLEVAVTALNPFVAEGILEGERRVLLRLLRRKFGALAPEIEARISQAKQADLERWAERTLEVGELEAVFSSPDGQAGDPGRSSTESE